MPRLLLYTLRVLHYVCQYESVTLGSEESIDVAVNNRVFVILNSLPAVKAELVPSDASAETKYFYGMLLAFTMYKILLNYDTNVLVPSKYERGVSGFQSGSVMPVSQLLKAQAFFLSRAQSDLWFMLELPDFHRRASEKGLRTGIPMLLSAFAGVANPLVEPWRVFEMLPVHILAVKAALGKEDGDTFWSVVVPEFFRKSLIASRMVFNLGQNPFSVRKDPKLEDSLKKASCFQDLCNKGAVMGRDKGPMQTSCMFSGPRKRHGTRSLG